MSVALVVSAFGQSAVKQSILAFMEQWGEAERSLSDDDVKLIVVLYSFVAVATAAAHRNVMQTCRVCTWA